MLLGKLKIKIAKEKGQEYPNQKFDGEYGRFLSKDLSRQLTEHYSSSMIAFYPSVVNQYSIELIVEMIGNHYLRGITNRFSFTNQKKEFSKVLKPMIPFPFEIDFSEENFCAASAAMIYCYKQDDYLIPDSDPHDVMSAENNYNTADFSYSGRFLPMIKLWCDLVLNSNRLFIGNICDIKTKYTLRKSLEFDAFSKKLVQKELANLKKAEIGFRPFNKYYKLLVSDRTMLPISLTSIIDQLYKNQQLCSRALYTLDIVDYVKCSETDPIFGLKLASVLQELRGSTLVVYIDVPNHFLVTTERHTVETDAYQKQLQNTKEMNSMIDNEFISRMQEYNLLDIDDALEWMIKPYMIRDMVNNFSKTTQREDNRTKILEEINRTIYSVMRTINVVFAYTDLIAYQQDYLFDKFAQMAENLSITKVELSDASFNNEQLNLFGQSIGMSHFSINSALENKDMSEYIIGCVQTIIDERTNVDLTNTYAYTSLYGFRYLINSAFDYRFKPDIEGNEYFQEFKKKRVEKLAEAEDQDEEEQEITKNKFGIGSYGVIDNVSAIQGSDDLGTLGFFKDRNFNKNLYQTKKENTIELDKMIGLTQIKEQIKLFAAFVELNKVKTEKDLKPIPISKHMVFMGNPGTAKTSVALQLAKILHEKGLIPTSDIKHVSRDDLVGKYVGWTARLVKEAIDSAKGGILFVDEAYSLVSGEGGTNSYGQEAINTFVNYMDKSDIRDSTILIFAGYKDEMKEFVDSNPGLKSRIGFYFDFPDYTTDELIEIAKIQASAAEYILEDGYIAKLRVEIEKCRGAKDFGNGRFVRNIFEKSILQQSQRLLNMGEDRVKHGNFSKEELITLKEEDFSTKGIDVSSSKKNVGFNTTNVN